MEKEIIDNHSGISATSVDFLDYAVRQGGCLGKLNLLDDDLPPMLRHYEYRLHSWPWFVSPGTVHMLKDCVEKIPRLIVRAIQLEFAKDVQRFCNFYGAGVGDVIAESVLGGMLDTRFVSQRTDAILTDRGLKIVELNLGFRIGGWQIQWMDPQYRKQSQLKAFIENLNCRSRDIPYGYMSYLIRSMREKNLLVDGRANVVFVIDDAFLSMDGPRMIGTVYEQALRDHGCEGSIHFKTDLSELTFNEDGVSIEGERLGAVVSSHESPPVQLYRACLSNQIVWSDNPAEWVLADKRSLALLYKRRKDPSFTEEERQIIEVFLPWATPLCPGQVEFDGRMEDLASLLFRLKDRFVIKVARGGKGDDVYVGKHQNIHDWMRLVLRGMAEGDWLVQEFCRSLPFYGQSGDSGYGIFDVVWGIYGFGDEYSGSWLRLMERDAGNGVINSDKGAEESIVYEVAS